MKAYHNIVLSMKSSNPQVMVQAYRLLVVKMKEEFGVVYPLHLGVTEAGDGEDGRIKSAIGIGTLLEDGIGDTIRVSLTEDPEFEVPVCRDLVRRYERGEAVDRRESVGRVEKVPYSSVRVSEKVDPRRDEYRRSSCPGGRRGLSGQGSIEREDLQAIGYTYDPGLDKWNIGDAAADYLYTGNKTVRFRAARYAESILDLHYIRR